MQGVILDLDGVVTGTARIHALAWKRLFDFVLEERIRSGFAPFRPFDMNRDYFNLVDGKPRAEGLRSFLRSRGLIIPEETQVSLGRLKNELFLDLLEREKPEVFEDALQAVRWWKDAGWRIGLASSSKNTEKVLRAAGLLELFETRVDGNDLERLKIPGKPAPDFFWAAAGKLGLPPQELLLIEDSAAGVQAGKKGGFGRVIGVDRHGQPERLREAGADQVVARLTELIPRENQNLKRISSG